MAGVTGHLLFGFMLFMRAVITVLVRHHAHVLHLHVIVCWHRIRHRHHAKAAEDSICNECSRYKNFHLHPLRSYAIWSTLLNYEDSYTRQLCSYPR